MKVTFLLEVLLICILIAFVASKSVQPQTIATNVNAKADNLTTATVNKRDDSLDVNTVQVVPTLIDSSEFVSNGLSNEVLDPVITDDGAGVLADKPSGVGGTGPSSATAPAPVSNEPVNNDDPNPINKYCSCTAAQCKCCRDFSIPLVPVRGPGCATIRYLDNDKLDVMIKYGDFVLASRKIDSRRTTPICVPLPGGYNRFCGRVYGISRDNENFKACLGLELRADDDVEASLRVSCFSFGPRGLATMEAEPLPPSYSADGDGDDDDDDDDDDGDFLGIGGGDDDDEDDEDEAPTAGGLVSTVLSGLGAGGGGDDDDDGFAGFSLLGSASDFFGSFFGSESNKKKRPSEGITINRRNDVKESKQKDVDLKDQSSISKIDEEVFETEDITEKPTEKKKRKTKDEDDNDDEPSIYSVVEAAIDGLSGDDSDDSEEKKEADKTKPSADKENDEDDDEDDDDDYDDYDDEEKRPSDNEVTDTKAELKQQKIQTKKLKNIFDFGYLGRFFNFFK